MVLMTSSSFGERSDVSFLDGGPTRVTVVRGDTLSNILFRLGISPLWGPHGMVQATLELNPSLRAHAGDLVRPGMVLILPRPVSPGLGQPDLQVMDPPPQEAKRTPAQAPSAELPVVAAPKANEPPEPENAIAWFWVGGGMSYVQYQQSVGAFSSVQYSEFKGPALFMRAGGMMSDRYGMDFSFKNTPGDVKSASGITVTNGSYNWQTMSAEGLGCVSGCGPLDLNTINLRLGFQQHEMPFMIPVAPNVIDVRSEGVTMASVGFDATFRRKKKLRFEWMMRYQYPIASAPQGTGSLELTPKYVFDGSLGEVFQLTNRTYFGFYWYGQMHQYSFSYQDSSLGVDYSGSQSLFYSTFDLRLGYEF